MFHYDEKKEIHIPYQVEINMISSGFGSMSSKIQQLHSYITSRFDYVKQNYENYELEPSNSYNQVPNSIKDAHEAFGKG